MGGIIYNFYICEVWNLKRMYCVNGNKLFYLTVRSSAPNQFSNSQSYRNVLKQQFCESVFEHCYIYKKKKDCYI